MDPKDRQKKDQGTCGVLGRAVRTGAWSMGAGRGGPTEPGLVLSFALVHPAHCPKCLPGVLALGLFVCVPVGH